MLHIMFLSFYSPATNHLSNYKSTKQSYTSFNTISFITIFVHVTNILIFIPVYEAYRSQDIQKYKTQWIQCMAKFTDAFRKAHKDTPGRSFYKNISYINISLLNLFEIFLQATATIFYFKLIIFPKFFLSKFHYITNYLSLLHTTDHNNLCQQSQCIYYYRNAWRHYLKMLSDMALSQAIEDSTSLSQSLPQNLMNKERKELMKEACTD